MIRLIREKINAFRLKRAFGLLQHELNKYHAPLTPEDTVDFLFSRKGSLLTPWQFRSEIISLFKTYRALNARCTMEIGTANGGTLFGHCKLAAATATIISVDLPGGKFGGGYPDWKVPIYSAFALPEQKLHLIRASSHATATVQKVHDLLQERALDYLFIDGDHTYEGVKKDYELYRPFVREGGLIVFHDIVPHEESACKVDQFWNEIKVKFEHEEYIDQQTQKCFGVGVLINRK